MSYPQHWEYLGLGLGNAGADGEDGYVPADCKSSPAQWLYNLDPDLENLDGSDKLAA